MFTIITNSLCCQPQGQMGIDGNENENGNLYQRERLQTIATVIDILIGIGLFAAGLYLKNTAMIACGAVQTWPLFAFITIAILGCKEGQTRNNIFVKFRPCLGYAPGANPPAAEKRA